MMFAAERWRLGILIATFATTIPAAMAAAQTNSCQGLTPIAGPDGYQPRSNGQRCEGLYSSQVSAPPIELVSLTRGPLHYDLDHPMVLKVRLVSAVSSPVTVRAVGIIPGLYYRLDARLGPGQTLDWPIADVLGRDRIPADAIGVYALVPKSGGSGDAYAPVSVVSAGEADTQAGQIVAVLRPLVRLSDLTWRFTPMGQTVVRPEPLQLQTYRATVTMGTGGVPLVGRLDIGWTDPATGMPHGTSFPIGG